uniref:Actin n=1 Tax=Ditylenchus dipsaci TaxID=166011 RepID=A0A915DGY9_9BILA
MSGGIYGGDDVGAIVFDAGSHSFRAGYGGEEYPKFDIPAHVGVREILESKTDTTIEEVASGRKGIKKNDYFIGTPKVNVPRAKTEVASYMKDGMIDDWDTFEKVVDYIYSDCLVADTQQHSVLFTEAPWNQKDRREKLTELIFEKFANGRTAGLILDSGATHTSAVPVYDGYCLTHAVVRSPIGGDFIVDQCGKAIDKQGIEVVPYYRVGSKKEVKDGESAVWTERKNCRK